MPAAYGYLNARVRGLRAKLLPPGFMAEQLDAAGFAGFTSALSQTAYGRDLDEAQATGERDGLATVDAAIARGFVRTTRALLDYADGAPRDLIALLLRRYDLANLKAVVRARHAGRGADEVMNAVLPAGDLSERTLRGMAEATDLAAAGQVLALSGHPLAEAFRKGVAGYLADGGDLLAFEVGLDRAFYARWSADAARLPAPEAFRAYVAAEVDATNVRTALKLRGRALDVTRFFVPGGRMVAASTFLELATQPIGTPLPALRGPFAALADASGMSEVDERLRGVLDQQARRLGHDPLDIGLVVDYLRRKEQEAARLRLIARGTFYGVPRAALAKELGDA
ncbi:MAG: V-type ATPase subunit [Trueperaceae bacterium]|nr:V-type ATPase subunit [Trueperaceae bacterium]